MRTLKMLVSFNKKMSFFQNVNMARFSELSESESSTILEEKDAENTKKATKVTLNIYFEATCKKKD